MNNKEELATKEERVPVPQYANMISGYQGALQIVDDVILKNYVSNLSKLDVVPLDQSVLETNIKENVLFFKSSKGRHILWNYNWHLQPPNLCFL